MTDFAFTIQFPRFDTPPEKAVFDPGIHVIYGESGVGKSRLCREIFSASHPSEDATFLVRDLSTVENPMLVMQDPDHQIVSPTVHRELAFNLENMGWDADRIRSRIEEISDTFAIPWDGNRHPNTLSGGEKELLNLATALSVHPDLLIIDDGLSFLSSGNKEKVVNILAGYCRKERCVVLWLTSDAGDLKVARSGWELRLDRLSRDISDFPSPDDGFSPPPGRLFLKMDGVDFHYRVQEPLFTDQSMDVGPFRSVAVLGENGSGKSTIGSLIAGLEQPVAGNVSISSGEAPPVAIGFLPQFPERFFGGRTFGEIVEELSHGGQFEPKKMGRLKRLLHDFQISWDIVSRKQIQREKIPVVRIVLMTVMFLGNYDLLVLDEPTFSLGENQRVKLINFIRDRVEDKHLIFITHSRQIARSLAQEAIVIEGGILRRTSLKKEPIGHGTRRR